MFQCNGCQRNFKSRKAVKSHWAYCPMKNEIELLLPPEIIAFENMGFKQKRVLLLEEAGYKCSQCEFSKTRENGKTILEIYHIDGDHTNNEKENLRVLCPNCHALTPNFRNWGRSKKKSSGRIRKENLEFENLLEIREQKRKELDNKIIEITLKAFEFNEIDFSRYGWVSKLNEKLRLDANIKFTTAAIGRKIRFLLPDFFKQNCYQRYINFA